MRKILFFVLFLITLFFIVDRIGAIGIKKLLNKTEVPFLVDVNYMTSAMNEDLLLFGTSKTQHGINPLFIEDSIGMPTYNCGISGGRNIYTQYMLLNYILDRYVPKMIVLQIGLNDIIKERDPYQFKKFAHLYSQNEVCDSFLVYVNNDKGLMISHLYRYNEISKQIIAGLTPLKNAKHIKGFEPLDTVAKRILPPAPPKFGYSDNDIDSLKLETLIRFIKICNDKKIRLLMVAIPSYNYYQENFYEPIKKIAHQYDIPFFDYNDNSLFLDKPEYFYDNAHIRCFPSLSIF